MPANVSVIIPNYNGVEFLPALLESLRQQTSRDFEIIIVDDCSPCERTGQLLRELSARNEPQITVMRNERNLGYARTCNRGIASANSRYICLLNNDTVVTERFIERNAAFLEEHPEFGVVSSTIVDQTGRTWFSGGRFQNGVIENLQDDFSGIREVDWVAGTAPFIRREVFERTGLLNETFGMYHEDVEFCARVRARTPFRIGMFSDKLVTHHLDRSEFAEVEAKGSRLLYYRPRNHILLAKMHAPGFVLPTVRTYLGELRALLGGVFRRQHPRDLVRSVHNSVLMFAGIVSGLVRHGG